MHVNASSHKDHYRGCIELEIKCKTKCIQTNVHPTCLYKIATYSDTLFVELWIYRLTNLFGIVIPL